MTTIQIRYDGTNIDPIVLYEETTFVGRTGGTPGECQIGIRDTAQAEAFIPGKTLELYINGIREWDGYLTSVNRLYFFEGHTANCKPCPHLTPRKFVLSGADRNILFTSRTLYDKADPTRVPDNVWPPGTTDYTVITESITNFLDLVDGNNYTGRVETVASPDSWVRFRVAGPTSPFGALLRDVSKTTGAVFYIDPDRYLVYTDVNTESGAFRLTDQPDAGNEVGYREFTLTYGADEMVNDAMIWGAGQGSNAIVFARVEDATSIATHGRWQNQGGFRYDLFHPESVNRVADSIVYGSPSNKRGHKDPRTVVTCTIFEPGLRVADKVDVTSNVFSYHDVLPIREMLISFPTPDSVRYDLRLSHELDEPWTTAEFWWPPEEGRQPYLCPTLNCSILKPGDPILDQVLFPAGTPDSSRFPLSMFVSQYIPRRDFDDPTEIWWLWLEDEDVHVGLTGVSVRSGYSDWWADVVHYNGIFRTPTGQVEDGPGYRAWRSGYSVQRAPVNDVYPGSGVTVHLKGTVFMFGCQGLRPFQNPDQDGFQSMPDPYDFGGGDELPRYPLPYHHVAVSLLLEGSTSFPTRYDTTATDPAGKPGFGLRQVGSIIWEGLLAPHVYGGGAFTFPQTLLPESASIDTYFNLDEGQHWAISCQIMEVPEHPKEREHPYVWGGEDQGQLAEAIFSIEDIKYHPQEPDGPLPPSDGDEPCYEIPICGPVCTPGIQVSETVWRVPVAYIQGSTKVTIDGIPLADTQYTESDPQRGHITLDEPTTGSIYICFDAAGQATIPLPDLETLFILPVDGPISGTFGSQMNTWPPLVWHGVYYEHFHNGVDFSVGTGTTILAAADGMVTYEDQAAGGTMIHIFHSNGMRTTYAHLSSRSVANGATVTQGTPIGLSGASGIVTGPHLHWGMVYAGSPEDPLPYSTAADIYAGLVRDPI